MAYKFVIALALVAVVQVAVAVPARPVVPIAVASAPILAKTVELEEFDSHPQYKYGYDVQDALSGDSKGHIEERDGDVVRGEYSLIDADGFKRTVSYTADPVNGFNAVVRREPIVVAAPIVKTAPLVKAAPVAVAGAPASLVHPAPAVVRTAPLVASPLTYSAPSFAFRHL